LESLLTDDVEAWSDGGGRGAARRPVLGRDKVARYLVGLNKRPEAVRADARLVEVNGAPAAAYYHGDVLIAVSVLEIVGDKIAAIRLVINPDKLAFVARQLAEAGA
ncbi:MAG: RNA polymerase subunit sigma-24, partial [Actinomycetota bacterium]